MDSRFVHRFVRSQSRHGGVLVIVLFTMMAVAFLASQGVRLMMLHNLNSDQRIKTAQLNELIELGRMRLASREVAEEFLVEVPDRFGSPARIGRLSIEKNPGAADGWRIIVRFPDNQPNEVTVAWESP